VVAVRAVHVMYLFQVAEHQSGNRESKVANYWYNDAVCVL